ncbi:MAG: hypothetical protein Q7J44_13195 [Pseudotabrizicola sp.]|uniref:TsoY family (seleno)protein n=1 Tax=Pseudotabrizicola sp. TaxID=2939647 RepID=UPI00271CC91F|nr:hypothetical protein [Pseudotabrizicola sp.]MDO9639487.1 hypothetical protein [Pseudotabrizicola sp.]
MPSLTRPADQWSPPYFLSALGAGGIAVTFFLWLYMWVPHPGQPVPVFEDVARAFAAGNPLQQAMIILAYLGLGFFAVQHVRLMVWNLRRYGAFKRSPAFATVQASNAGAGLFGLPLMLGMTVNVSFSAGLAFVPGLWSVVEYLFPLALLAFGGLAVMTLRMMGAHLARLSVAGRFDMSRAGSFLQVQPAFALGMIGVGMSAPAALSASSTVAGIALVLSTVLLVIAVVWAAVGVVLGVVALLQHGVVEDQIPTLMNIVPLMAVLGILMLRQNHGLHVHFGVHAAPGDDLWLLTALLAVQIGFLGLGLSMMRQHGYVGRFMRSATPSAGAYGLVCPGVGLAVLMQFWINKALVGAGLVAKFGTVYWGLTAVLVAVQIAMLVLLLALNRRHFGLPQSQAVPAE